MSEYHSLYIRVKINEEKLQQFFEAKSAVQWVDTNWQEWWDSREMYSKQPLEQLPHYSTQNNRAIFDQLLHDRDFGSSEHYDAVSQNWTFISVFFSENYIEILSMLTVLKHLSTYQQPEQKGIAMIYDFCWGSDEIMAYLEFADQQALLKKYTSTREMELAIREEVNHIVEAAMETFNRQFED